MSDHQEIEARLRALCEQATPGQWTATDLEHGYLVRATWTMEDGRRVTRFTLASTAADAEFIAAARHGVPALLDALADLRAQRDAAQHQLAHFTHCRQGQHPVGCKYGDDDCPTLTTDRRVFDEREQAQAALAAERADNARLRQHAKSCSVECELYAQAVLAANGKLTEFWGSLPERVDAVLSALAAEREKVKALEARLAQTGWPGDGAWWCPECRVWVPLGHHGDCQSVLKGGGA